MICALDVEEFIPYGRQYSAYHPGNVPQQSGIGGLLEGLNEQGITLHEAIKEFSIKESGKKDFWRLRSNKCLGRDPCEEELYIDNHLVVWSRGSTENARRIIKSFTVDSPVREALWCSFFLPLDQVSDPGLYTKEDNDSSTIPAKCQQGVCVVQSSTLSVFTTDGHDYSSTLPFQISSVWSIKKGLLIERVSANVTSDIAKTPQKDNKHLPILFSLMHPLEEAAPVICRTGGSSGKVSFVTDTSQQIVYSNEDPPLLVTYDRLLKTHSVWTVRAARIEEGHSAMGIRGTDCGMQEGGIMTPSCSQSASGFSRLTISNQSPSYTSPLLHMHSKSKLSSASECQSKTNSPSFSRLTHNHSSSPGIQCSASFYRLQTPSPHYKSSPAPNLGRTPVSLTGSIVDTSLMEFREPLIPEICIDHLWTEGTPNRDTNSNCQASKVFLIKDLCGQKYLSYLIPFLYQLRCVKFNESNDRTQLIFGSISTIQARDAVALESLDMTLILDMNYHLVLYSGTTKINQIYVGGLPDPHSISLGQLPGLAAIQPGTASTGCSPVRLSLGPVTSSRPPSAMEARFFNDDLSPIVSNVDYSDGCSQHMTDNLRQRLSPVPTEYSDTSQVLENSLSDDLSFHMSHLGQVIAVRDAINNRFTLELSDNRLFRATLPPLTKSHTVQMCLDAIRQVLPKTLAMFVLSRWYSTHNAPGSSTGQSEWHMFVKCLLAMIGYDVEKLALTRNGDDTESSMSPVTASKKLKPSDQGSDEDWNDLISSDLNQSVLNTEGHLCGLEATFTQQPQVSQCASIDHMAPLFTHFPSLLFALHLVYEEMKLDSLCQQQLEELAALPCQMARDLRCELYTDYYSRDFPDLFCHIGEESLILEENFHQMNKPSFFSQTPPCIYKWLCQYLEGKEQPPFPYLYGVSDRTIHVIAMYVALFTKEDFKELTWSSYMRKVATAGIHTPEIEETIANCSVNGKMPSDPHHRVVLYMSCLDVTLRNSLQHGIALPLKEAIYQCRDNPPGDWPAEAYTLIGREDLAKQKCILKEDSNPVATVKESTQQVKGIKEEEDGMEHLDEELQKLEFSKDLRVQEVRRLLQSSKPVRIAIQQRPEVSDSEYIEEQERHLYCTCVRTMALPLGRGMFTLSTYHPVPTETVPIPKLCLTGRAPPRNTTVDLSHIETPANMTHWPLFHNGVAAGLRIANTTQLDSAWIIYNRPQTSELTNEHAGFLMGLGLNGHLKKLATLNVHDYLIRAHDMTSIGLILGLAAGKRGTMDVATVRLLSIHVAALLPPTSTELAVPHNIQVTAIMGIGLIYQGTANRHIAEVLLQEIGRPPGPEMANCTDRESYSLAAGLALGLVMLGRGSEEIVLSELNMADELYHYMVGGQQRPLSGAYRERYRCPSYQIKEGDAVNVDVTSPGATLALGLMFFNTNNSAVAEWLTAPDTQFLLDFVRPDFLMLRIISRGLVMWDKIYPTVEWVNSNLPEIVAKYAFNKLQYADDPDCDIDFETMSQAYCNIVAGACMALGLKFAGTSNEAAYNTLFEIIQKIMKLTNKPLLVEQAGKSTVENSFMVMVLSLAMVTAGTGNLEVLRLCRYLRARVGQTHSHVLYGSHMAVSMATGLLFLGGGRYSLSTSPEAVAAMLCAFFPKFPIHSNDNRYHLQAFRHLYVLAAEPRVLIPRDVSSGDLCYVPLEVTFKKTVQCPEEYTFQIMAPWILPELDSLKEVKVIGPRYWHITFHRDKNWDGLVKILKGCGYLYVKQRAGHLSYAADPKGYHSMLANCLVGEQLIGRSVKTEDIRSFSSDPRILAFAELFCSGDNEKDSSMIQFLSRVLHDCVSHEKLDILPIYVTLQKMVDTLDKRVTSIDLWQLKLMLVFYKHQHRSEGDNTQLVSEEFLVSLTNSIQHKLHTWTEEHTDVLMSYYSGQTISSVDTQQLAAFLTWYDVPHPALLGQMGINCGASFPQLYKQLQPLGLSLSATMAISMTLQHLCA